jgi:hypothetical protein
MKTISLVLFSLLFCSCARDAELLNADSSLFGFKHISPIFGDKEIDPLLRSGSIVIYPTAEEIKGFEYEVPQEQFDLVSSALPTNFSIAQEFRASDSTDTAIENLVYTILSSSISRDNAFISYNQNEEKKAIIQVLRKQYKKDYKLHPCYKFVSGHANEGLCSLEKIADETKTKASKARSCSKFVAFEFANLDADRAQEIDTLKANCEKAEIDFKEVSEASKLDKKVRAAGQDIVVDMLLSLSDAVGTENLTYFAPVFSKEREDDGDFKTPEVVFNLKTRTVDTFRLAIDFNTGEGSKYYSLENGKITNFRFSEARPGFPVINFDIVEEEFIVRAELSYSDMQYFDVRFAGEIEIIYNNGITKKGGMKLEFDYQD